MVTFWGLSIRISCNIPYVCVTEDADIYKGKRSELGKSCLQPSAARRLLESFINGIFIIKKYKTYSSKELEWVIKSFSKSYSKDNIDKKIQLTSFDDKTISNHTNYCESVRPFDELIYEILRWKQKYDNRKRE